MYNLKTNDAGVRVYADDIDPAALKQISTIGSHPSLIGLLSIMPNVHAGAGSVMGFTGKFGTSVIPNIVGADIGCGVTTHNLMHCEINLSAIYDFIEKTIPTGLNSNIHKVRMTDEEANVIFDCEALVKKLKLEANPSLQAGTLGGGDHFIEIEQSKYTGQKYLTVHTGSRTFGLEITKYYQRKAKELMEAMNINVPQDLGYLPLGDGQLGNDYIRDMKLAQRYADANRTIIMRRIIEFMGLHYYKRDSITSVHNYISERDNIIRKGAISAHCCEPVVIALNMGKYGGIVLGEGLGNKDYNCSAPRGVGRIFSRNVMKRKLKSGEITMKQFNDEMRCIYSRSVVENVIDKSPMAYKPYNSISKYLAKTVNITDICYPIMSFKAT